MKKRYIIMAAALILTVAYIDLADSIKQFDRIISDMLILDSKIKVEMNFDNSSKTGFKLKREH